MRTLRFWNGNKSDRRQEYELALLKMVLNEVSSADEAIEVVDDRTDFPKAEDEGAIFQRGFDACVTVAGNPKFAKGDFLPVYHPLMNGLLGHRLLIVREEDRDSFSGISDLQQLNAKVFGVPATWADADLFRANGLQVSEKGSLDTLFQRLKRGECDYVSLGVNEVWQIFDEYAAPLGGLVIEQALRLYYPFALVFYVAPHKTELANRLAQELGKLQQSGKLDEVILGHNAAELARARLSERIELALENDQLPSALHPKMESCKKHLLRLHCASH